METTIVKIEGNKIQVIEENEVKEYELADYIKREYVDLGSANITIKDGKVSFVAMQSISKSKPAKPGPTDTKKKKWEDDIVSFEDLLTAAHDLKAPFSIITEMLAVDLEKQYALFKARVVVGVSKEKAFKTIYEGHGDSTKENVTGEKIKPHFIRMAETRAIVRALRWYTNNGCAEEEK